MDYYRAKNFVRNYDLTNVKLIQTDAPQDSNRWEKISAEAGDEMAKSLNRLWNETENGFSKTLWGYL
jgi:hypothetical protein